MVYGLSKVYSLNVVINYKNWSSIDDKVSGSHPGDKSSVICLTI